MTTKHMLAVAALACGTIATASADDVYLTGSSAFRGTVMKYLRDNTYNARAVFDKAPAANYANFDGSSFIILSGNWGSASGQPITIYCAWTGSVGGIRDVSTSANVEYLKLPSDFTTDPDYLLDSSATGGKQASITKNAEGYLVPGANTASHVPDFGFSDVFQNSTVYTGTALNGSARAQSLAVLPFKWIASNGASGSISNVTPQLAQTLFKTGNVSLAQFTGLNADAGKLVWALGRNNDSGTRLTAFSEMGLGAAAVVTQWLPTLSGNNVNGYALQPDDGNFGYASGGDLATALTKVTTAGDGATTGFSIGYLSVGDATSAITGGAVELSHNGVAFSIDNVKEGKYTFWCYEHVYDRGDLTAQNNKAQAGSLLSELRSNLPTAFTSDASKIRLSEMNCYRSSDGTTVFHN
ncbi:MAG: hypothetical protein QM755_23570 [Luteolibacter sp.]